MTTWVLAGAAGTGKTTTGRALAALLGAALLDLDTVTNPLLDDLGDLIAPGGHWNEPHRRDRVRAARYAVLLASAADQVRVGTDVVLVAPFTRELRGGPEWAALRSAVGPGEPRVVWLTGDPDVLLRHLRARGEGRDAVKATRPAEPPGIDHLAVDAALPTRDQLDLVLGIDTWTRRRATP